MWGVQITDLPLILGTVLTLVYDLTDPVLRPFRGLIPPIRMGAMAMDLSPILLFIVLGVLMNNVVTC